MNRIHPDVLLCAELIRNARSMVVITGAGISTAAGIPDFRGPEGLYSVGNHNPELVFNLDHFLRSPLEFYTFTRDFVTMIKDLAPTVSHFLLAVLEQQKLLTGIITQNIDPLHRLAGSRRIVELHGSYWSASCVRCADYEVDNLSLQWWSQAVQTGPRKPIVSCPACGGIVKPDVVFFGEAVRRFDEAVALVEECDLLLVLGSSLTVYPAALLPRMAGAMTVVVNRGAVRLAPAANRYFIDENLDCFFENLAVALDLSSNLDLS